MLRWMIVTFLALVLIQGFAPFLRRLGLGRLPGDFSWRIRGRDWHIPLGSTVVLTALFSVISLWI